MVPAADINPLTGHSESGHPFAYAKILNIFSANVSHQADGPWIANSWKEFLLVHWYRLDTQYNSGFKARRLHCLELVPEDDPDAFGFLDPDDVIHASHIIPAFAHGHIKKPNLYYPGIWQYYYVNL